MKSTVTLLVALSSIILSGACSTSGEDKTASKNAPVNSQNNANSTANAVVVNGMFVPPQPGDPNTNTVAAAGTDSLEPSGMTQKRMNKMRQSGESTDNVDIATLALKNARPAPENSTFTSYLADSGYEIRTFKAHPQLLKVEKQTESNGNQTLRIFLRNGQVIQRPGKDIAILSTAPAATILAVGGITPPPPPPPPAGAPATKKSSSN